GVRRVYRRFFASIAILTWETFEKWTAHESGAEAAALQTLRAHPPYLDSRIVVIHRRAMRHPTIPAARPNSINGAGSGTATITSCGRSPATVAARELNK